MKDKSKVFKPHLTCFNFKSFFETLRILLILLRIIRIFLNRSQKRSTFPLFVYAAVMNDFRYLRLAGTTNFAVFYGYILETYLYLRYMEIKVI